MSGRRVMEGFQAYLFKTSAYLNATRGFREFGFLLRDSHSSEMRCSWDHAHAPSVLRYLLLTPNRAGSQSVSGGGEGGEGRIHLFLTVFERPDGRRLRERSDRHKASSLQQSKHFAIILLMIHLARPDDGPRSGR